MPAKRTRRRPPTLEVEASLWRTGFETVGGMDEVGRGAWAGPVVVCAAVLRRPCGPIPEGLMDSKFLTPRQRERMVPVVQRWVVEWGIGEASVAEIGHLGIFGALRAAGLRALAELSSPPEIVILDGGEDYMTARQDPDASDDVAHLPTIRTEVKGDVRCAAVTAASVLAKTYRDQYMQNLANQSPEYGWQRNAGYHTAEHLAAYTTYGPSIHHRRGWGIAGSSDPRRQDQATNRTAEDTSSA